MTIVDPFARNRPPYVDPYEHSGLPEEHDTDWYVLILAPDGAELVLDQWVSLSITEAPDGVTASLEVNGLEPMILYMRMMTTDLVFYRNNHPMYRMKITDAEDTLTRDADVVSFEAVGYEKLLERRILHADVVLDDEDLNAAWWLINDTQTRWDLGIRRGTLDPGVRRQRSLHAGDSILGSINDFAEADAGFDWWIDHDLLWWAQKPRRGRTHDVEWRWGNEIAELVRTSIMDDYASLVMTTGAQNETRIPDPPNADQVYPPPLPAVVEINPKPTGLWERCISYSDVITPASLLEKANWHLNDLANIRATYKITLESGTWTPDYGLGDVVTMRVEGAPRLNIRVPIRIEEISIGLTADGDETINMSVRAEQPETILNPDDRSYGELMFGEQRFGGTLPAPPPLGPVPSGRTVQRHRLRPWDDLAALMRGTDKRLGVQERRSPGQ